MLCSRDMCFESQPGKWAFSKSPYFIEVDAGVGHDLFLSHPSFKIFCILFCCITCTSDKALSKGETCPQIRGHPSMVNRVLVLLQMSSKCNESWSENWDWDLEEYGTETSSSEVIYFSSELPAVAWNSQGFKHYKCKIIII